MKLVLGQELDESTLPGLDGIALSPIELREPESTIVELCLVESNTDILGSEIEIKGCSRGIGMTIQSSLGWKQDQAYVEYSLEQK